MTDAITSTPRLVRFKQACAELEMSTDSGYQNLRNGTFPVPTVKVGKILKVRRSDLDRFLFGAPDAIAKGEAVARAVLEQDDTS